MTITSTTLYSKSLIKKLHKVAGYQTPQGKVYCKECADKMRVEKQETFYTDDESDWSITCERCESTILDMRREG